MKLYVDITGKQVTVSRDPEQTQVHRSFARNAKLAFYLTALAVALPLMTVLADHMHPIIAAIVAVLVGTEHWATAPAGTP